MEERLDVPSRGPMLSRWSAILCGVAVALGTFLIATSVWLVFASAGYDFFVHNFVWFILGTALGSAIVSGFVAGYVEDWRGAAAGVWNGLASWGLIVSIASVFVLPNFLRPLTASHGATGFLRSLDFQMMVAVCCAFGGGFILAGIAASIGAAVRRPVYRITPEAERRFFESLVEDSRSEDVYATRGVSRSSREVAAGSTVGDRGGVAASPTVDTGNRDQGDRDYGDRNRGDRDLGARDSGYSDRDARDRDYGDRDIT